jgi:hypothetical protein
MNSLYLLIGNEKFHMIRNRCIFFSLLILVFSCGRHPKYSYAIKDFRSAIQPQLMQLVSVGVVHEFGNRLDGNLTNKELLQLTQSEHPVLRAAAFEAICNRNLPNAYELMMDHLDDTAIVSSGHGEFGISFEYVSDNIIQNFIWKTQEDHRKTVDAVLTKHNYLESPYQILFLIGPEEKYHRIIYDMAARVDLEHPLPGRPAAIELENALYALAGFKNKKEVPFIRDKILTTTYQISDRSMNLMSEYPDTAYLQVYETYFTRYFRFPNNDRQALRTDNFVQSVAIYKSERSARILDAVLNYRKGRIPPEFARQLRSIVADAIHSNQCPAYLQLSRELEKDIQKIEVYDSIAPLKPEPPFLTNEKPDIRWWN